MGNPNDESPAGQGAASGGFSLSHEPIIAEAAEPAALESSAPGAPAYEDLGELPASYHEDSLFLTARDPHWLFSYWDFAWVKVPPGVHGDSPTFHLRVLRADGTLETSVEVRPEARNWHVPVSSPDSEYSAELGYFGREGEWVACIRSASARTPPDAPDRAASPLQFATARPDGGAPDLAAIGEVVRAQLLAESISHPQPAPSWSPALLLVAGDSSWPLHMGSAGGGPSWPPLHLASAGGGASWPPETFSVPAGFSMHVNAEVIFYGGTEPDARVTIGGEPIHIEPDGNFRFHFRLPDGDWNIPIVARSADGREERSATLSLNRHSRMVGEVASTPQPPELPPEPMGRV